MTTRLVVRLGDQRHEFEPGADISVGRASHNDLTVDSGWVSREHATIRWTGASWTLDDHSRHGTFDNGRRLSTVPIDQALSLRLGEPTRGPELRLDPEPEAAPGAAPPAQAPPPAEHTHPMHSTIVGRSQLTGTTTRIGRAADNDFVLADDLRVSRRHAELRTSADGRFELVDVGSRWGTYVDGHRITRTPLAPGQVVRIGSRLFELDRGTLVEYLDDRATLTADQLTVTVERGVRLLDGVSFTAEPGQLVAIVGPSGAGKSTLVKSLTGAMAPSSGQVRYNGQDLRDCLEDVRSRMGVLPQDDILHPQLRARTALRYAAELRFADDTSSGERQHRVDEVLHQLALDQPQMQRLPISRLSGGQRKRASLALELLTRPALLLCDEPTTGLDLHREREVMQVLRDLANEGRTVLVITHTVASLDLCDRVLCLAAGGRMAYYGPPGRALAFFGATDWVSLFAQLEDRTRDVTAGYLGSPDKARYVDVAAAAPRPSPPAAAAPSRASPGRQFATLVRRNVAVLLAGRAYAALLALQAPLIAGMIVVAVEANNPRVLAMLLTLSAVAVGLVNGCREIVRELPIYRRERAVGLSRRSYLQAKAVTLIVLVTVQCSVLVALVLPSKPLSSRTLLLGAPVIEVGIVVCLVGAASVAVGLALSAWVRSDASALVAVPVLIVACLLLSGAFLPVHGETGLAQAAWTTPSYWGTNALAASSDLKQVEGRCEAQQQLRDADNVVPPGAPRVTTPDGVPIDPNREVARARGILGSFPCPGAWDHDLVNLLAALVALVALTGGYLLLASVGLGRHDRAG